MTTRIAGLGVLVALAAVASLVLGPRTLDPGTVLDALRGLDPGNPDHLVVTRVRLPRTLIGLAAGVALGLAGGLVQGLTRNPIADPGILGLNAGASLMVVLGIGVLGVRSYVGYVWFGFAGAALAGLVVAAVAGAAGGRTPTTLALAGAALTAGLLSVTTAILLTRPDVFDDYRFWQIGSLAGREVSIAAQAAPFLVVGVVLALGVARPLDALALGDDVAAGLGFSLGTVRIVAGAAVVLLAGTATAMAGPIGFLGLTVPHVARALVGPGHRRMLPAAMLLAPALLLLADVVGRVIVPSVEIGVGIVTAVLGAPVFVALVRRRKAVPT